MKAGRLIWNAQDYTRMRACTEASWSGIFFIIVSIGRTINKDKETSLPAFQESPESRQFQR